MVVLAVEEDSSVMESLRIAVGGKEDDCHEGDGPHCEGDCRRDWEGSVFGVSDDARHPLGAEGRLETEVALVLGLHWALCQLKELLSEPHEIRFELAEVCSSLDVLLIPLRLSGWIIFLTVMDSSESFLPCTLLEKAADSTEEHQTEVLAALAQVPAEAS